MMTDERLDQIYLEVVGPKGGPLSRAYGRAVLAAQPQPEPVPEACAKIAEQIASQYSDGKGHVAERVANAIRLTAAKGKP